VFFLGQDISNSVMEEGTLKNAHACVKAKSKTMDQWNAQQLGYIAMTKSHVPGLSTVRDVPIPVD
jgi:hypothetical protein